MRTIIKALLLLQLVALPAVAEVIEGRPIILDGDTLLFDPDGAKIRVRIFGIDAPEMKDAPRGVFARRAMDHLAGGRELRCIGTGKDRYGRTVGVCGLPGPGGTVSGDLALGMLQSGWATVHRLYAAENPFLLREYDQAEAAAVNLGCGQFAVALVPPPLLQLYPEPLAADADLRSSTRRRVLDRSDQWRCQVLPLEALVIGD